MDRNIITAADAVRAKELARQRREAPPKQGKGLAGPGEKETAAVEGAPAKEKEPDTWEKRLLKYIPGEAIGLYLFLQGIVLSAAPEVGPQRVWLSVTLLVALVFNALYLRRIWKVQRVTQILISCAALMAYVFALGGVFATFSWYVPWQGTFAMTVMGAFLIFVEPPGPSPDTATNREGAA